MIPAPDPGAPPTRTGWRAVIARRRVSMSLYAVAFVAWWLGVGLPTDPMIAFIWLWLGTIAWNPDRPWRERFRFARDWIPIVILLVAYDFSRGLADNHVAPHVTAMIDFDKWLFGGHVPTIWLQDHFYNPAKIYWYDVAASWIYFSHFVVSLTVAVILWLRSRPLWAAFMRRWFTLTALGLATYFLYPAAPPWWASVHGYLPAGIQRMSGRGWDAIGLHSAGKLLNAGQALSNPVAAMPSLHSAFSACVVVFFLSRVRKRWWPLLLAYPLTMAITLMYTGEHYAMDAVVGWTYVALVFLVVGAAERLWRRYQATRTARSAAVASAPDGTHEEVTPEPAAPTPSQ
jgi:hypothetical protein